jgi:hypothetical protein
MTDPYWWPAGKAHRGSPNYVSKITRRTVDRGRQIHKPVMIIPMAETWGSNPKRQITAEEQRCQTYLALIHGAKGLLYFRYPLYHQSVFLALSDLAREVEQMAPALLTSPGTVEYSPPAGDPVRGDFPDVQARLCRFPGGDLLLLAANGRAYAVDASYRVAGLNDGSEAHRLFEDASWPVRGGTFSDTLPPYATRAYRMDASAVDAAAPAVTVTLVGHPDEAVAEERALYYTGRTGRKNIMTNPGFEQATVPGKPDYVWPFQGMPPTSRWGMASYPMALDPVNPYEGTVSFRLSAAGGRQGFHLKLAPALEKPEPFVFSIYLRGDSPKARAGLYTVGWGWEPETIGLTTNWQRHVISGTIPPGLGYNHGVRLFATRGTVWADAMQLEKGTEATEYEP